MELLNHKIKKGKYTISSGDIFEVSFANGTKGFFQFLYKDEEYMTGHLIRGFNCIVNEGSMKNLDEIIKCSVKFFTYTRIFEGLKDGLWKSIGNMKIESDFSAPVFRQSNDVYSQTKKSYNWFIWQHDINNKKFIGELTNEYKQLPFSSIMPPSAIVEWLETGSHGFLRPE